MSAFEELGICPEIIQSIEADDWLLPTPVQQEAIPLILTGGDVLVASQTGSGKTGAFGLPCLQIVHEDLQGKCKTRDSGGSDKRCELSLNDKDTFIKIMENGLECKSEDDRRWYGVRGTFGVLEGKYMYEVEVVEGLVRIGWSAAGSRLELGMEEQSWGFGSTGKKSNNREFVDYGESYKAGDVVGCLVDRVNKTISFSKNGLDLGEAYKFADDLDGVGLMPHVCGKAFALAVKFDGPMEYPVEGYEPLGDVEPEHLAKTSVEGASGRAPMCLILEPTRDLADQTFKNMMKFNKNLADPPVKMALLVGGEDDSAQRRKLKDGVDIVVGTLQKTMDHVRKTDLDVTKVKFFVLDEADDLQKKDERKDISQLNEMIKHARRDRVQTLFFSATLHTPAVKALINEITDKATWVDLKGKDAVPDTLHACVYYVDPSLDLGWGDEDIATAAKFPSHQPLTDGVHSKPSMSDFDKDRTKALRHSQRVKEMKPKLVVKIADSFKMPQCLVFCRTNIDCNNLESYLCGLDGSKPFKGRFESGKENPYSCVVLGGARNQKERQASLEAFKDGDVRFLIATDVAARGIDIAGLPFVIQMTVSDDIENYIHRIGRCGRADRLGLAISLVSTEREKVWYHKCASRGKNCTPPPGNTKLTIPFGADNKVKQPDTDRWWVDEGGCTVWLDESDILQQVETRIGESIHVMDPQDFSVHNVLESPLPEDQRKKKDPAEEGEKEAPSRRNIKRKGDEPQKIQFGAKKNDATSAVAQKINAAIAPTVVQLTGLETQVQKMFAKALFGIGGTEIAKPMEGILTASTQGPAAPSAAMPDAKRGAEAPPANKPKKKVRW